jgi:hypothetical protein
MLEKITKSKAHIPNNDRNSNNQNLPSPPPSPLRGEEKSEGWSGHLVIGDWSLFGNCDLVIGIYMVTLKI